MTTRPKFRLPVDKDLLLRIRIHVFGVFGVEVEANASATRPLIDGGQTQVTDASSPPGTNVSKNNRKRRP